MVASASRDVKILVSILGRAGRISVPEGVLKGRSFIGIACPVNLRAFNVAVTNGYHLESCCGMRI